MAKSRDIYYPTLTREENRNIKSSLIKETIKKYGIFLDLNKISVNKSVKPVGFSFKTVYYVRYNYKVILSFILKDDKEIFKQKFNEMITNMSRITIRHAIKD